MKYEEMQYPTRQDMRDEIGRLRAELTIAQTWQEHLLKSNGELEAERNAYLKALTAIATPPSSPHYDEVYLYHDSVAIAREALNKGDSHA